MSFSAEWLALREPADHQARNRELLSALAEALSGRARLAIIDLGCGAGSNLRAVATALGAEQDWRLIDYDPVLLDAARDRLAAWADEAAVEGERLRLRAGQRRLGVSFFQADLSGGIEDVLGPCPDLVTAAALFDLVSEPWIERFAARVAATGAVFYTALTYNGRDTWMPPHPADDAMRRAFHVHQGRDKGFGPAAGPKAVAALRAAFEAKGYRVSLADSPWRLGSSEPLVDELARGAADAVRETGLVPEAMIADWLRVERRSAVVGHTDLLALPPQG